MSRRWSINHVKSLFSLQGCEFLGNEYLGSQIKYPYRCVCGRESSIRVADFNRGHRCQSCKGQKASNRIRYKDDKVRELCAANGCQFLSTRIENKKTKIAYICSCGQAAEAYLTNYKRYPNCWDCGRAKKSGEKCWMWNPDREAVAHAKRFRKACGQFLIRAMKKTGQEKTDKTYAMLGYTALELQEHIFNHPDMPALAGKEWHIDHIIPIQAFLDHGVTDLKVINALSNLRPMEKTANISKGHKYDKSVFSFHDLHTA